MTDATANEVRPLTGWKVLWIFCGCFGVIFAVNFVMAYDAISTFRGEVRDNPYEAGIEYNNEIAAAEAQAHRRWKVDVTLAGAVRATFRDAAGQPLAGLAIRGVFAAPSDMKRDRGFSMTEIAPGVYAAEAPPTAGVWDLRLTAARGEETLFQSQNRVKLR